MGEARRIGRVVRGEVYLVTFDPTVGSEIQKTRPALVIQNDITNRYSPLTIVAAITSRIDKGAHPTKVLVSAPEGGLSVDSMVLCTQIRSVDKQRLIKRLGKLTHERMKQVDRTLMISLGLVEL